MNESSTTRDILKSLTPRERQVLRQRFGLDEPDTEHDAPPPNDNGGDDSEGNSGAPAPMKPPL